MAATTTPEFPVVAAAAGTSAAVSAIAVPAGPIAVAASVAGDG